MCGTARNKNGFTLLETVIALALWSLLMAGACGALTYTARLNTGVIDRQDAFENARAAMDALLANIHLADVITLETDAGGVLKRLKLMEIGPDGRPAEYNFYFNKNALPGTAKYHRLEFGLNDEFASRLESVRLSYEANGLMLVTVVPDTEGAAPLYGSADARYKRVTVTAER